jgi:hypothetical protein
MSQWHRFHLDETITAMAIPDNHRFLVRVREPVGENRKPIEFYRGNMKEAQRAADRLVQAYYPHECDEERCGEWERKLG